MKQRNIGWVIARVVTNAVIVTLLVWFMLSWWDVATHNTNPVTAKELSFHSWNLFVRYFG